MKFIGRVRFMERSLLLIILLKDYIKVIFYINMKNVNLVMSMPQLKTAHLHSNVWTTTKIIRKGFMKKFKNTFQFCDWDINKICVICEKGFIHELTWISGKKILSIITSKERILQ